MLIATHTNLSGQPATVHLVEGQHLKYVAKWPIYKDAKVLVGTACFRTRKEAVARAKESWSEAVKPS